MYWALVGVEKEIVIVLYQEQHRCLADRRHVQRLVKLAGAAPAVANHRQAEDLLSVLSRRPGAADHGAEHLAQMAHRIEQWGVEEDEFVAVITEKSEGNFMYLVHVLRDIRDGRLTASNVDDIHELPKGLRRYYQRHWRAMRAQNKERFDKYYEPMVCILATVREPVTIAQVVEWTKLSSMRVKEVIQEWHEFLNIDPTEGGEPLYRIYHASFREFLEDELEAGLTHYDGVIAKTALDKIQWPN